MSYGDVASIGAPRHGGARYLAADRRRRSPGKSVRTLPRGGQTHAGSAVRATLLFQYAGASVRGKRQGSGRNDPEQRQNAERPARWLRTAVWTALQLGLHGGHLRLL